MAILITGGAGYIGTHTMVELLNAGKELVVVDNFINSKPIAIERVKKLPARIFDSMRWICWIMMRWSRFSKRIPSIAVFILRA